MKKLTKVVLIIGLILLFFPSFSTLIDNQAVLNLRHYQLLSFNEYPFIGEYMPQFLFWVSAGCLIFLILGILIVIFFPSDKSELRMDQEKGKLVVQKRAIENYVLEMVREEPFIADARVSTKIYKKKINVQVQGKMRKVFHITEKQAQLSEKIKQNLTQLIGNEEEISTKIVFKDLSREKAVQQSRVK